MQGRGGTFVNRRRAPVWRLAERGLRVFCPERLEMAQDQRDLCDDRMHAVDFAVDPLLLAEPGMRRLARDEAGACGYSESADHRSPFGGDRDRLADMAAPHGDVLLENAGGLRQRGLEQDWGQIGVKPLIY